MAEERPIVVARVAFKTDGTFAFVDPTHPLPISIIGGGGGGVTPIAKAAIFNTALPAADNNILGADITPTNSPSYITIYACIAVAGIFRVRRTQGGVTVSENLNGGVNLVANAAYMWTVPWRTGDSINFWYSATGANILSLIVDEIGAP
jgi:hypothetical protein